MQKSYTKEDIAELVESVGKAFTTHLAKAEEVSLAKSEDGEKDHKKEKHEEKEEHEEKPEHKEENHEDHEEKNHEDHEDHGEGHDYDEEDMAHMEKMYRSMSKGELSAHHGCIQKCMGKSEAKPSEMGKSEIERCEPGKIPGAKSEASDAHGKEINKAEIERCEPGKLPGAVSEASDAHGKEINKSQEHENGGEMSACKPGKIPGAKSEASKANGENMNKSENEEIELLKSELETQKKNFAAVQEFLTKLVKKTAPQGKAITSLEVVAKSEASIEEKSLSKSEIHEVLKEKTANPSLKKSDRDAINAYYLSGQINVGSISHLLK